MDNKKQNATPAGWKLVPTDMTDAMRQAASGWSDHPDACYAAALLAAPEALRAAPLPEALRQELDWCIAEGHSGPRTHACLVAIRAALAAAPSAAQQPVAAPDHKQFALVMDRHYEGQGITLAIWNGENYQMTDGDCYDRDGDTLGVYPAEFLTDYELEQRLNAAPSTAPGDAQTAEAMRILADHGIGMCDGETVYPHEGEDAEQYMGAIRAIVARFAAAPAAPSDPMDTPIPCDLTVGGVTIKQGCPFRTVKTRMESLNRMAMENTFPGLKDKTPGEIKAQFAALAAAPSGAPVLWRFIGPGGLKKWLTDAQYQAQTPGVRKWYEPMCSKCPSAAPGDAQPIAWIALGVPSLKPAWITMDKEELDAACLNPKHIIPLYATAPAAPSDITEGK
jgi:hypothetical protein